MASDFSMEDLLNQYPPKKTALSEKKKGIPKAAPTSGLGHKSLEKMDAQAQLDIHGMTSQEAMKALGEFITKCWKRKIRRALIIHGKGKHSQNGAVLKPMVIDCLANHPKVAVYGSARKKEGGTGATWFSPLSVPGK